MASLSFSLSPEAIYQLHDALMCLGKFGDSVSFEAEFDLLRLSVLNITKTAYAAFVFEADKFFESYSFGWVAIGLNQRPPMESQANIRKALVSVFKGRASGRNKDTSIERCEFELQDDPDETESRLVIRLICGLGVIKLYKLTYEPVMIQHATFDRSRATNEWSIEPKFLKEVIDHFGPSAEQLDIYSEHGKTVFTSFTTKIAEGKEILRQPVHTSVAIDKRDFEFYQAEDNLHIAINLRDFKAVIAHADVVHAKVTARFTHPCRPLQFAYELEGMKSEFTLMTRGEPVEDDGPSSSRATVPQLSARQTPAPVQVNQQRTTTTEASRMPPPRSRSIRPLTGTSTRTSQTPAESQRPAPSVEFDSLFVPADDDRQWDVPNEEEPQAEDELGWDATGEHDTFTASLRARVPNEESEAAEMGQEEETGIPPTQRISQVTRDPHPWTMMSTNAISSMVLVYSTKGPDSDNPACRATGAHSHNIGLAVRQRDRLAVVLDVTLGISARATVSMLAPTAGDNGAIIQPSKDMLAADSQILHLPQPIRRELSTIIPAPSQHLPIIQMYIDSMPTSTYRAIPCHRLGGRHTRPNPPLIIHGPKHSELPLSAIPHDHPPAPPIPIITGRINLPTLTQDQSMIPTGHDLHHSSIIVTTVLFEKTPLAERNILLMAETQLAGSVGSEGEERHHPCPSLARLVPWVAR
ncbi:putative DNA repair protein rad9 [Aspergillus homomorphus CBS 101889]|uniref:DNA repair protein rad9 n=1 Tax=Aspergillus homomorphus (strain CBS 101889) TaxID=1450537 RepID=A0A395HW18_ASPHC|nr:hypothetical protein BO97DRAFT_470803 [Aspergillus homomorphus CBS 101889]RAL11605.1 hypothetical protein BO97DRAFT_470803 [Aspergillus homomorphus CBS 101889]